MKAADIKKLAAPVLQLEDTEFKQKMTELNAHLQENKAYMFFHAQATQSKDPGSCIKCQKVLAVAANDNDPDSLLCVDCYYYKYVGRKHVPVKCDCGAEKADLFIFKHFDWCSKAKQVTEYFPGKDDY